MQVNELSAEGLKRAYSVTVPAADMGAARDKRLGALAKDLRIPGFRPGKVPMSVVKGRYGTAVMGEVLEERVQEATRQIVTDRGIRPALQPKVEVQTFEDGADLEFRIDVEVLPDIPMPDFAGIAVERPRAEPSDEEIDKALLGIANRNAKMEDVAEDRPAAKGDIVVADFTGRLIGGGAEEALPVAQPAAADGTALPTGWRIQPVRTNVSVAAAGDDHLDLRVEPLPGGERPGPLTVSFQSAGVPASPGEAYRLTLNCGVVAGPMPAGARALLRLRGDAASREQKAVLSDQPVPLGTEAQDATHTWTVPAADGEEPVTAVRPQLIITLVEAPAEAFVVRVGGVRLFRAGTVAAEPFAGGSATDMPIEVGGEGFIPGFTEGLEGIRPGETRKLRVTFPEGYANGALAGKPAEFEVTAKALKTRAAAAVDEDFAKSLGLESLDKLREELRASIQREYDGLARMKVKRALLDQLSERADFPVPEGMVQAEFDQIWQRVEADMKAGRLDSDDAGKDEETLRAEYRRIAERRIRLGLLLAEIGRTNSIQVPQDEIAQAMRNEAARYPGQERQVLEFFQKNPQAIESIRAPLFEEKVVDFMLELAKVTDTTVTPADLQAA